MRERLVAALVGLTVLVVALYGVPRAYVLADLVRSGEQARVERTARALATVLDQRVAGGQPVTSGYLDTLADRGEEIDYLPATGQELTTSAAGAGSAEDVSGSYALEGGGEVTVVRTADAVNAGISRAVLVLVLQGLALVVLAAVVGLVVGRRMARPFQELADAARGLGAGRFHPDLPATEVPEAREIGRALAEAGHQLDLLLQNEREVAVRASHELRTPVTALRLELEDLALWPETPPSVADELGRCVQELDRLSVAIADLLALSETRHRALAVDLDLDALVAEVATDLDAPGAAVVHRPGSPAPTRLEPALVTEVLGLLVQRARAGGAGPVQLSVQSHPSRYEVRVTTPGGLAASHEVSTEWASAAGLAAATGGQITREGGTLVLRLPRNEVRGAGSGGGAGGDHA